MSTHRYAISKRLPRWVWRPTAWKACPTGSSSWVLRSASVRAAPGGWPVPPKDPTPDPETRTLNAKAIAAWSPKLADAVEAVLDAGEFPVVLGGDCTIVLGSMLALRAARPLRPVLHRRQCRLLPA